MNLSKSRLNKALKVYNVKFQDDPEEEIESRSIVKQIKILERERDKLLNEINELKKMAKSKANALESEVALLREEANVLKEILHL